MIRDQYNTILIKLPTLIHPTHPIISIRMICSPMVECSQLCQVSAVTLYCWSGDVQRPAALVWNIPPTVHSLSTAGLCYLSPQHLPSTFLLSPNHRAELIFPRKLHVTTPLLCPLLYIDTDIRR